MPMDWFESLMGFREKGYAATQNLLELDGDRLRSTVNGAEYGIGTLELVSLAELRARAGVGDGKPRAVLAREALVIDRLEPRQVI